MAHLRNPISGYERRAKTDQNGAFSFINVPQNQYHVEISASGFENQEQDVNLRSAIPITLPVHLALAGGKTEMTVEAAGADLLETVTYAHNDIDKSLTDSLPTNSPGSGLSDAITLGTPGVAADSNGFFHPLGDHAQVTFSCGRPTRQRSAEQAVLDPDAR